MNLKNDSSLQEIESPFERMRLKFAVNRRTNKADIDPEKTPRLSLNMIESWTGEINHNIEVEASEDLIEFSNGDVLFSKLRPYLAKAVAPDFNGAASPEFLVLDPVEFSQEYLLYICLSEAFVERVDASTYGAKMPRASWDFIGDLRVPCPDIKIQDRIVDKIERNVSRINKSLAECESLLNVLEEKKSSVIANTITTGINNNSSKVQVNTPWFDNIPSNWGTTKLMYITGKNSSIAYGILKPGEEYENGVPYLDAGDVNEEDLPIQDLSQTSPEIASQYKRSRLEPGDLVYSIRGSFGDVQVVPEELEGANLSRDVARIHPREDIDSDWLCWAIRSEPSQRQFEVNEMGTAVTGVNIRDLKRLVLPFPPENERKEIASALNTDVGEIETCKDNIEQCINLLKEKRQALITAAVTGQIDVTEEQESDEDVPA